MTWTFPLYYPTTACTTISTPQIEHRRDTLVEISLELPASCPLWPFSRQCAATTSTACRAGEKDVQSVQNIATKHVAAPHAKHIISDKRTRVEVTSADNSETSPKARSAQRDATKTCKLKRKIKNSIRLRLITRWCWLWLKQRVESLIDTSFMPQANGGYILSDISRQAEGGGLQSASDYT